MKHAAVALVALGILLLARGSAAADDEKKDAPAKPVDVPGFWTDDELRRIDQGLDVLNVTRKDLGFQKRPIDDPFRLTVVNRILDEPLAIGPIAAEWDAVARNGNVLGLLTRAMEMLPPPTSHEPPLEAGREADLAPAITAKLPESARHAFNNLVRRMSWAATVADAVCTPLAKDRASFMRKVLSTQVEKPQLAIDAPDMDDAAFLVLAQKVDLHGVESWSQIVGTSVDNLVAQLKAAPRDSYADLRETIRATTPLGGIVLSGVGDDIHDEGDDVALVIDLGGNDTYTHGASANLLKNHPVSVVIDLAGDDRYIGENDFSFGGALGGVAIQWDCGGNDTYRGGNCSCGAGILGVGVLVDEGGDDIYRVKDFGEGAGAFGIGLLLDKAGNDTYRADKFAQGFASTWGCGMLIELAGNDVYYAAAPEPDTPLWRDRYQSLSQGFGFGMRPDASGGVGVLVDVSGNDHYSCDIFGQGTSYWFSLGLLIDDDGHDTYACGQYGQGSGIHLSCGMLLDRHGQDNYYDANGVGMGGAHDYAVGFLVDREGDDYYSGGGCAQGSGHTNSVGMLIDDAGDDGYSTVRGTTQGDASFVRSTGGIGLLLDGAGNDSYSERRRNDGVAVQGTIGALIDEPTPPERPSANPMNAAISKEDATRKVEADGMKDGRWDLDKLWAIVGQWEVGDNTVIMPIAREKFFALGKPALDRVFENLNDKHGLVLRAVEFTLKEFAKTERVEIVNRLVEKTKDADKLVRKNTISMLSSLQAIEALPRLEEMLAADPDTNGAVLSALAGMHRAPPSVTPMLRAAKEGVGVQAAVCLGSVGDAAAIDALVAALGPDFSFPVRLAAVAQLGALGAKAAAAVSKTAVDATSPVMQRRNALRALGSTNAVEACDALAKALVDPDCYVRFSAMLAASDLVKSLDADAGTWLSAALDKARDAETDPLVKRLVLSPASK